MCKYSETKNVPSWTRPYETKKCLFIAECIAHRQKTQSNKERAFQEWICYEEIDTPQERAKNAFLGEADNSENVEKGDKDLTVPLTGKAGEDVSRRLYQCIGRYRVKDLFDSARIYDLTAFLKLTKHGLSQ